jgi:hypothetical protein
MKRVKLPLAVPAENRFRAGETLVVAGIPVTIVSDAEAEAAPMLVCPGWSLPLLLPDNLRAACFACGAAVQHRPMAPKRPPRVCYACADGILGGTRH